MTRRSLFASILAVPVAAKAAATPKPLPELRAALTLDTEQFEKGIKIASQTVFGIPISLINRVTCKGGDGLSVTADDKELQAAHGRVNHVITVYENAYDEATLRALARMQLGQAI